MPQVVANAGGQRTPTVSPAPHSGGEVPWFFGTNIYVEKIFTDTWTMTTSQQEFVHNINPGGYLRGYRVVVGSSGGALGGGTLSADAPWSLFASMSLENLDGAPMIYPMGGYAQYARLNYSRPWLRDPATRGNYSAGPNPGGSLFMQPEIRQSAGCLANTDARAQYRSRVTVDTLANFISGGAPTAPTLTISQYMEAWAQPDKYDLEGRQIGQVPPGIGLSTLSRHQFYSFNSAGTANTIQLSNMGNEQRLILFIARNSSNVRTDLLTDPIRWRIDARSMGVFAPQEVFDQMDDFYGGNSGIIGTRPAGVYAFPRFYRPGEMFGQSWLGTTNATYIIFESATGTGGTNGSLEIITDEVAPNGEAIVPRELESI